MQPFNDLLISAATRWYDQHLAEHLSADRELSVKRCAAWLLGEHGAASSLAHRIAVQALGVIESRNADAYVDADRTTAHLVWLVDPASGREFGFTAADLAYIARGALDRRPIAVALRASHPAWGLIAP
jgi:hypothetical protein